MTITMGKAIGKNTIKLQVAGATQERRKRVGSSLPPRVDTGLLAENEVGYGSSRREIARPGAFNHEKFPRWLA